jgi:hypothetical protein
MAAPDAVVNAAHPTSIVPLAGVPLAVYTVSCTVVTANGACATAATLHPVIHASKMLTSVKPLFIPAITPPTSKICSLHVDRSATPD